jgi:hypothetical protein
MKLTTLAALFALILLLTYKPKTSNYSLTPDLGTGCCNSVDYRANNNGQCSSGYYQGLQFGDTDYGCTVKNPTTCNGVII